MEFTFLSNKLKKFNLAQIKEMKRCCKDQDSMIEWVKQNSKTFRKRYNMKKTWYTSKTIIFNVLSITILILQYVADIKLLDPEIIAVAIAAVNLILRKLTTRAIA